MSDLQELMVGSTRVVALKDGELTLPKEILLNVDEDTAKKLSDENNQLTNSQINAYLIFKNEKIIEQFSWDDLSLEGKHYLFVE